MNAFASLSSRAGLAVLLVLSAATAPLNAQPPATENNTTLTTPTIFVCGDSTAKNTAQGAQGWGTPLANYFDPAKAVVDNVAHAGTSSRTYYNGDWPKVLPKIKPGDVALVVFGINDGLGSFNGSGAARASLNGIGDETQEVNGEAVHTYGWYMGKIAADAQAKGARVYFLTVTARDIWTNPNAKFNDAVIVDGSQNPNYNPKDDKIERGTGTGRYTQWTKAVGAKIHVPVLDLTNLLADNFEKTGREKVMVNYLDHNHTNPAGADIVAAAVVSGLKAFKDSPFIPLLSVKGKAVGTADAKYVAQNPPDTSQIPSTGK